MFFYLIILSPPLYTDVGLTGVKRRFPEITVQQIADSQRSLEEFDELFHTEGPGTVGKDLEHGLQILKEYKRKLLQQDEARFVVSFVRISC